jgi:uncharacterized membrane protein
MIASTRPHLVHYVITQKDRDTKHYFDPPWCSCCVVSRIMNLQHMNGLAKALSVILIIVIISALILSAFPV